MRNPRFKIDKAAITFDEVKGKVFILIEIGLFIRNLRKEASKILIWILGQIQKRLSLEIIR